MKQRRRQDLESLLAQPTIREARPCDGCAQPCGCSNRSTTCSCGCSPRCSHAAAQLSSEGERYPIEPYVLPLVFELNALRVVQPCWSCEGHADAKGDVQNPPRIWFYCASVVYPQLLLEHVTQLAARGELQARWRVTVCSYSEDKVSTTFSLEPAVSPSSSLAVLQSDLNVIAAELGSRLRDKAQNALNEME